MADFYSILAAFTAGFLVHHFLPQLKALAVAGIAKIIKK